MKKLVPYFLIVLFSGFLISCNSDDNNTDTVAEVYEIRNQNFSLNQNGDLTISSSFINPLFGSDMVLIYRKEGQTSNGNPIWGLIPKVYTTQNGSQVEYTNDFTVNDIQIYLDIYTSGSDINNFQNNQTFRVLVVPAILGRSTNPVDFNDYQATVNYYNLQNAKVVRL